MEGVGRILAPGRTLACAALAALVLSSLLLPVAGSSSQEPASAVTDSSFTFGAAGNIGSSTNAKRTLDRLAAGETAFFLALGDLSLNKTGSEGPWSALVKSKLGPDYPFEVLSGDNEDNGPNGLIDNFASNLTNKMAGLTGLYGKEYYFDYPAANPLARFIEISPKLTFTNGGAYTYTVANSHLLWLAKAIDGARASGIPWVIVGMHTGCLSTGNTGCDIGQDLVDFLTIAKVDLVLQAHDATYQRSKQLACSVRSYYLRECVADVGANGTYAKGGGTVFVIAGTGGAPLAAINVKDPENPYFTPKVMGSKTAGWGYGYVRYTVSADRIDARTDFNGTWSDAFSIAAPAATVLTADFSWLPGQPVADERVTLTATVSGGTPPYNMTWAFGDGSSGWGTSPAHAYAAPGSYPVALQATDAAGRNATRTNALSVASSLSPPAFVFAAAGDIASTADSSNTLTRLGRADAAFFLAIGDLSVNGTGSEYPWSVFVKSRVGADYPFEILSGNHEDTGTRDGLIDNFVAYLPDRMNATGIYGKEYYFDTPRDAPIARFILISPGLSFAGTTWSYVPGNAHYDWLAKAIDGARVLGIPWTIVAMHKPCLSTSGGCDAGQDVQDLLSIKKVDFVLSGHHHSYQRSKALACGLRNYYVPSCVRADGATDLYPKGAGTLFQVEGVGGQGSSSISKSDGDYGYFTSKLMGSNTVGRGYGFVTYAVRPDRVEVETDFSGTFADRFTVAADGGGAVADLRVHPASLVDPGTAAPTQSSRDAPSAVSLSGQIAKGAWAGSAGAPSGGGSAAEIGADARIALRDGVRDLPPAGWVASAELNTALACATRRATWSR